MDGKKEKKAVTKEMIAYGIAGVLTTAVNLVSYDLLCNRLHTPNLWANALAWILSVMFAFVANDRFVFTSKEKSDPLMRRVKKFVLARAASFAVDEGGMFLFVDGFHFPNLISKIFWNVIVIVMNYVLSKRYIFH